VGPEKVEQWALVLGASSGFGAACARKLAEAGLNIFGVHLDRRSTLGNVEKLSEEIKAQGRDAEFFNTNAAGADNRAEVLDRVEARFSETPGTVKVLVHSLAFGTLKPYVAPEAKDSISQAQIEMTLDVMANSLVYWVQDLSYRGLMGEGGRIYAMTSAGSQRVVPNYGAVSAAKAALESHIRQLAVELASKGITVNAVRAGITDTPALRKIPGHEELIDTASQSNPSGRMTTPDDVAAAIATLVTGDSHWITGTVIGVDGGEDIAGF
jgi:NAD(P)-dependent dehydrogenase (short-subunit alcohol dehydrogenase family)